jgi:serine/threonine-protein kinase
MSTSANQQQNQTFPARTTSTLLGGHDAGRSDLGGTLWCDAEAGALEAAADPGRIPVEDRAAMARPGATAARRTTVLPRRYSAGDAASFEQRPRFQRLKHLGEGAMGRVELVRDNDIQRTVAVKQLITDAQSASMQARFADEVRIVGQLEHPGIVPVYDVDRGESGELYLVMKHLQGETMEQVIDGLRSRQPGYAERFSLEYRVRTFLGILDAVSYAHSRSVLHRDLKPANILIGPFGEVTVLDWGIAKPMKPTGCADAVEPWAHTVDRTNEQRLLETQPGQIAGTPLYMSPEQAAGLNGELDQRSDVYSLCVLFYEWLVLQHPLADRESVQQVMASLILDDYEVADLAEPALAAGVPMEYLWIIVRGLVRNRDARYQSAKELEAAIRAVHDGNIEVRCEITFAKSYLQRLSHWIDRHPRAYRTLLRVGLGSFVALVTACVVFGASQLLRLF